MGEARGAVMVGVPNKDTMLVLIPSEVLHECQRPGGGDMGARGSRHLDLS